MRRTQTEVRPGELTDDQLGIDEDAAPDDPVAALMDNPALARLLDAAVERRLAQLGQPALVAAGTDPGLAQMVASLERLVGLSASQQPGYSRPLPAAEIDRRQAGWEAMQEALDECKAVNRYPKYRLVSESLFAGEIEYKPGHEIETLLIPNEFMVPQNDEARRVHSAFMQWIGGPQKSIGERVFEAEAERHNRPIPEVGPVFRPAGLPDASPIRVTADPPEERRFDPRRPPAAHEVSHPGIVRV
jgi:hypothetical protein